MDATTILQEPSGDIRWYTFAGGIANLLLTTRLSHTSAALPDNLSIRFRPPCDAEEVHQWIASLSAEDLQPVPNDDVIQQLKFSECLPRDLAAEVFLARCHDPSAIRKALSEPRRIVIDNCGQQSSAKIESSRVPRGGGASNRRPRTSLPASSLVPDDPALRDALQGMKALSMRQPHAEAVMRGVKTIEYRSGATNIRGRILIYATRTRYEAEVEQEMMDNYGIDDASCDDLPRGVLVGTVELFDSDEGEWHLRLPERLATLLKPSKSPQPVWFDPF